VGRAPGEDVLFNSVEFLVLLGLTLVAYWSSGNLVMRQIVLGVASVIFYVSWSPPYLILLLAAIWGTQVLVLLDTPERRWPVPLAIVLLLTLLGFVKYADFARRIVHDLSGSSVAFSAWKIILPLGISFYVFQMIAYAVDVRRGEYERERNPFLLALFIMFFPHLIAGPICRPHQLLPQLKQVHRFEPERLVHGFLMIACGLFLKIAIADNLSGFVDLAFGEPAARTPLECLAAALVFGIVIFCDFWGYSTIAVGAALAFGVVIPQNFNLPYAAGSLQEFWRRWHITLSSWLRDYLYKPLGGSRAGSWLTYRNLIIVMVLGGLWHGANYTFLIWGALHGGWLVIERLFLEQARSIPVFSRLQAAVPRLMRGLGWAITMFVVFVGWVFFRADSAGTAVALLKRAVMSKPWAMTAELARIVPFVVLFLLVHVPMHRLLQGNALGRAVVGAKGARWTWLGAPARAVLAFWITLSAIVLGEGRVAEFIYFQF
jgi:alginate O-acetyltransferase complex protein AlgI